MTFPEDNLEFQCAWSSCAGQLTAYRRVQKILDDEAAKLFINKKDNEAKMLRDIATRVSDIAAGFAGDLDKYINESMQRP